MDFSFVPFFFLKSQETFVSKDNNFNVGKIMSRAKGIFQLNHMTKKLDKIELHQRPVDPLMHSPMVLTPLNPSPHPQIATIYFFCHTHPGFFNL